MSTKIFINLQVKDLQKSTAFFTALGYTFNPIFTNHEATCMIISSDIFAMLITENGFTRFRPKGQAMWQREVGSECATCLSAESKAAVDAWAEKALSLGATENIVPDMQPPGDMMYGRSINDLDGHIWEIMWMNPVMIEKF